MLPPSETPDTPTKACQATQRQQLGPGPAPLGNQLDLLIRFQQEQQTLEVVPLRLCQRHEVVLAIVVVKPNRQRDEADRRIGRRAERIERLVELKGTYLLVQEPADLLGQCRPRGAIDRGFNARGGGWIVRVRMHAEARIDRVAGSRNVLGIESECSRIQLPSKNSTVPEQTSYIPPTTFTCPDWTKRFSTALSRRILPMLRRICARYSWSIQG
jgi:hypothetical protein